MSDLINTQQEDVELFDINDPALSTHVPEDLDPDAIPQQMRQAPPSDGYHWIKVWLNEGRKGPAVYTKGTKDKQGRVVDGRVVVALRCRTYDPETGQLGGFIKDWYPTSSVMKGGKNRGSQVTAICKMAGRPTKPGWDLGQIKDHVEEVFADAGDEGVACLVKTQWVKSAPKVDDNNMYVYKEGTTDKEYVEIKGEKRIKDLAVVEAQQAIAYWEANEDESPEDFEARKERWVTDAPNRAHLFEDTVSGKELSAQAEVREMADPADFVQQ